MSAVKDAVFPHMPPASNQPFGTFYSNTQTQKATSLTNEGTLKTQDPGDVRIIQSNPNKVAQMFKINLLDGCKQSQGRQRC